MVNQGMHLGLAQLIDLGVGGLAIGSCYSLGAIGFAMILRATNIIHFAQGEVMMLGAIGSVSSPASLAAAQVFRDEELPQIVVSGTAQRITTQGNASPTASLWAIWWSLSTSACPI
jgi:branched-subunit amino acid ABC-type transport system permease component